MITAEGRSRAYINGTPCPLGDLKSLGELLIDIHSQHEHQSLLKSETHRRLLDEYAGCQELARQVQLAAQRWKQTSQELERLSRSGEMCIRDRPISDSSISSSLVGDRSRPRAQISSNSSRL